MRRLLPYRGLVALVATVCLAGCEAAKSANPTAPSVAGPIPGVSITAPKPLEPGAGSTLVFGGEPPTLLIENSGTSGVRSLWMQVEVGTDAGFQQVVHSADRLTPGEGGRTTYRLPEPLGAGYTYYWRARAQDGANVGPYRHGAKRHPDHQQARLPPDQRRHHWHLWGRLPIRDLAVGQHEPPDGARHGRAGL